MFNFFKRKEKQESRSVASSFASLFGLSGSSSTQGNNALKLTPVYSSIRYLADTVGMTQLVLYRKDKDDNRFVSTSHPLLNILKTPQKDTTFINWFQSIICQTVGFGNGYAVISRDKFRKVEELIFVPSSSVSHQLADNGDLIYHITLNNKNYSLYAEDVIHLKGMSLDGKIGISPISYHNHTLDRSYNESDFSKQYYENASNIGSVLEHPSKLNKDTIKDLKENLNKEYGGTANTGKTLILSEGMTYKRMELISPTDANYVASKDLTDKDIANIFRVPVVLLNNTEAATYANVENLNIYFQMYSLNPLYRMIEQEFNQKLISPASKNHYFEFNPESLMNANSTQKTERLDKGIKGSFLTPNEARRQLNLNAVNGGDDLFIPLNYVPFSKYDEVMIDEDAPTATPKVASQDDLTDETKSKDTDLEKRYASLSSKLGRLEKTLKTIAEK